MSMQDKQYLGDSVYAQFDGWHVWLCTDNGRGERNLIALEPDVMLKLIAYAGKHGAIPALTREGIKRGITAYAWWKDGVQYVGTCGKTLAEALADVDAGRYPEG